MTQQPSIDSRLQALRQLMSQQALDAFIVPHEDEFLGEYTPEYAERLAWLTGFTGSAGLALVLTEQAALFVDGRYTVQARNQVDQQLFSQHHLIEEPFLPWLCAQLERKQRVGIDPRLHSLSQYRKIAAALAGRQVELVPLEKNPIDCLWKDRPEPRKAPALLYPQALAGRSSTEKREAIASDLRKQGLDAALLTQADSINWLLNLRGHDIPCLPVVLGFAVLYSNASLELFTDMDKLDIGSFTPHVGFDVTVYPLTRLGEVLTRMGEDKLQVLADATHSNAWTQLTLEQAGATLVNGVDPCQLPKACKNASELAGMEAAHRKDAVAMCRFLAWLDKLVTEGGRADEAELAEQLTRFRQAQTDYLEPSFDSISALGPNAAMCHYNHTNGQPRALGLDGMYLIDSGGQYLEGTTDITRTIKVGEVSDEMRQQFTRVMRGHIALAQVRFPKGTAGVQLDVLARLPLWQAGFDYDHGTGHGVGHFLSVHEGPQRIGSKGSLTPLQPGMVLSNEPGYYREAAFGIRCENLMVVESCPEEGEITRYQFRHLTLVPFDTRLLAPALLSAQERQWINDYHAQIRAEIGPQLDEATQAWLQQATVAI